MLSTDQPLTLESFTAGLEELGYHRRADRDHAGHGVVRAPIDRPYQVFWVDPDGRVCVITPFGSEVHAGDAGDGWIVDGLPVDTLAEALDGFDPRPL